MKKLKRSNVMLTLFLYLFIRVLIALKKVQWYFRCLSLVWRCVLDVWWGVCIRYSLFPSVGTFTCLNIKHEVQGISKSWPCGIKAFYLLIFNLYLLVKSNIHVHCIYYFIYLLIFYFLICVSDMSKLFVKFNSLIFDNIYSNL